MTLRKEIQEELMESAPTLAQIHIATPYKVPAGYFEKLPQVMMERIHQELAIDVKEELEAISPVLAGLKKTMPYSVPDGYFDKPVQQPLDIAEKRPARVISLQVRSVFRFAAAAVTVGIISLMAWLYLREPGKGSQAGQETAATEVITEKQVEERMDKLTEQEIASFIESGSLVYSLDNGYINGELADLDPTILFEDVSDQELEQYLQLNQPQKEKFN